LNNDEDFQMFLTKDVYVPD